MMTRQGATAFTPAEALPRLASVLDDPASTASLAQAARTVVISAYALLGSAVWQYVPVSAAQRERLDAMLAQPAGATVVGRTFYGRDSSSSYAERGNSLGGSGRDSLDASSASSGTNGSAVEDVMADRARSDSAHAALVAQWSDDLQYAGNEADAVELLKAVNARLAEEHVLNTCLDPLVIVLSAQCDRAFAAAPQMLRLGK